MAPSLPSLILFEDIRAGTLFAWRLPSFLRNPICPEEARVILRRRLKRREADFLALAHRAIYENATSPYRELLAVAGCEYGDLERLVTQDGVEGALRTLYRHGVYLTVDEFKGTRPVIRGATTITMYPRRLWNPWTVPHLVSQSSGSRSTRTLVPIDLAFLRDRAVNVCLTLDARGGTKWSHANWGVPGGGAMSQLLIYGHFAAPPVRWFSQIPFTAAGLHPRYRWGAHVMCWGSLLAGVPLPRPQYVPLDHSLPIVHWMRDVLQAGGTPHLVTFTSAAVRLCQAAIDAEIDLSGAQFTVGGEPLTQARQAAVHRSGAEARPGYGTSESGSIGDACLAPEAPDDLHVFHDLVALVQADPGVHKTRLPSGALLISSLCPRAPLILLNVSLGDQAVISQRGCGCPLERLGWATHLHTIRSYEKLTSGGMSFLDTDVIRVLEEVLPARFGGAPTDYQLLEDDGEDGHPRLRLLVHPAIGPLDAGAVAEAFLSAISPGSGVERVMGLLWRDASLLRVERRAPKATASGKILHLHLERCSRSGPASGPPA